VAVQRCRLRTATSAPAVNSAAATTAYSEGCTSPEQVVDQVALVVGGVERRVHEPGGQQAAGGAAHGGAHQEAHQDAEHEQPADREREPARWPGRR
jgi:hypothetical protein